MFGYLPWKSIVKRAARAYGLTDPALWLARVRSFAQPSEVGEPIELLSAGVLFHARGIVNTKAIQHNLDWVWPYWVVRQFDPNDVSFIPRAFSFSHVNLTHRNWTAVRYEKLSGRKLDDALLATLSKAIKWLQKKRVMDDQDPLHVGLLRAGFSAEHLGPNDHYYWDDFWAEAGLRGVGDLLDRHGRGDEAKRARAEADSLHQVHLASSQRSMRCWCVVFFMAVFFRT